MVSTRSQRASRSSSKSDSDSRNSKHSNDVEKTDSKRPVPSNDHDDEKPQPDSSIAPVAARGRDAVAMVTTSDECGEKEQPKGKRSRKRNRKRKPTVEHDGQTEESTFSSPDDVIVNVKHQKTVMSEDAEEDSSLGDSKPAGPTASIVDETQKENILIATTGIDEVDCKLEVEPESLRSEAEMIPAVNLKEVVHLYKQESFAEGQPARPKGRPKSGRPWKTEQTMRFSGMKQDRPLRSSWQKKMQQKAEMKNLKMFEAELKEAKSTELERKKKHRAKKIKRKLENQRKSEIVQVISNPAKMKRMKKKQLRKIEMRSMPDSSKKQVFKA